MVGFAIPLPRSAEPMEVGGNGGVSPERGEREDDVGKLGEGLVARLRGRRRDHDEVLEGLVGLGVDDALLAHRGASHDEPAVAAATEQIRGGIVPVLPAGYAVEGLGNVLQLYVGGHRLSSGGPLPTRCGRRGSTTAGSEGPGPP